MNNVTTIGIDLAKNVFQLHGVNQHGKTVYKKRVKRDSFSKELAKLPPCLIGMEACSGAHYWADVCVQFGHTPKLMAPQFVKPYVKGNKNDALDAQACCEAVTRPTMRFVAHKNSRQLEMQALHRTRSLYVSQRTQLSNHVRGVLAEHGMVFAKGHAAFKKLSELLEKHSEQLSQDFCDSMGDLYEQYQLLIERIDKIEKQLKKYVVENSACQQVMTIPGLGPIMTSALVSTIGRGEAYDNGRHLSAWLGLVPKQESSGDKIKLGGISKRGDRYLRNLLIHGARSVVQSVGDKTDLYSLWIKRLLATHHKNKVVVAVANKNARIAWALLHHDKPFDANLASDYVNADLLEAA